MRISDWSSDVCSSDLADERLARGELLLGQAVVQIALEIERRHAGIVRVVEPALAAQAPVHLRDLHGELPPDATAATSLRVFRPLWVLHKVARDRKSTRLNSSH